MSRSRKFNITGLALVTGSVAFFFLGLLWIETRKVEPLTAPIPLIKGTHLFKFQTDIESSYGIGLDFPPVRLPHSDIACALGINDEDPTSPPKCSHQPRILNLRWSLYKNGKSVPQDIWVGDHDGSVFDDHSAERVLAVFQGASGDGFTLIVTVQTDGKWLAATPPVLRVDVAADYEEGLSIILTLTTVFAVLSAALGIFLILLPSTD